MELSDTGLSTHNDLIAQSQSRPISTHLGTSVVAYLVVFALGGEILS